MDINIGNRLNIVVSNIEKIIKTHKNKIDCIF